MDFHYQLLLNAGQKYCRILQGEHSAILLTLIKLLFVMKIFVLSILSGRFTQVSLDMLPKKILKVVSASVLLDSYYSVCSVYSQKMV